MNFTSRRGALILVLTFSIGLSSWVLASDADGGYSNRHVLSELNQQANVLSALMQHQDSKAQELLITRIQSDLAYFQTELQKKESPLSISKLCQSLHRVAPIVQAYLRIDAEKGRIANEHLEALLASCPAA